MTTSDESILQLYDTFTASKRPLRMREPGRCGLYCCGPTVYDMSHIGHARAALVPDVLVRFLRAKGIAVTYVRNVTDIDDKIIKRANETGQDAASVATRFTDEYHHDLAALGLLDPDIEPRVTAHMGDIISMIETLERKGLAYRVEGDVYYEVKKFGPYGKLSKRNLDDMEAGARVEVDARKRDPADFALWKSAKPGEPAWDSPWGRGRPGWHIECSAMCSRHLGETFDIHAGGRDLIFPHHENEIAQSQGAYGEGTFAQHWLHNGFVNFAGEKMAKSVGNFFTIREVTALYHPEVLRYFLLQVHYRSGVNFDVIVTCPGCGEALSKAEQDAGRCDHCQQIASAEQLRNQVRFPGLEEADERVAYVYETLEKAQAFVEQTRPTSTTNDAALAPVDTMNAAFMAAMADDLNTAAALAVLSEPLAAINRLLASAKGVDKEARKNTISRFVTDMATIGQVLGCFLRNPTSYLTERRDLKAQRIGLDVAKVESLVRERNEARNAKDWTRADSLRDALAQLGVKIRDAEAETIWSL